jgi:transcription factor S
MDFCSKCNSRLVYKSNDKKLSLYCPKCKKKIEVAEKNLILKIKNDFVHPIKDRKEGVVVIDKNLQKLRSLPVVNSECYKCNGTKAETWELNLGSEDNSQAVFYRCIKCGHTWRITD